MLPIAEESFLPGTVLYGSLFDPTYSRVSRFPMADSLQYHSHEQQVPGCLGTHMVEEVGRGM
jgi:hypothetical protein